MKILKQATYIRYITEKQSKFVLTGMLTSWEFFYKELFEN